jgi:hypothetical protein
MKFVDWRSPHPALFASSRGWLAVAAVIGLGLAASGCAQSMSELAGNDASAGTMAAAYPSAGAPTSLAPSEPLTVASMARPAVLVDETTEPVPTARSARTTAPMAIAPATAELASAERTAAARADLAIAPSAVNLNQLPAQPKSKLLTPEEKAQVIAELEALAKKQSVTLGKAKKSAECAADDLDPAARLASATGDGEC